jgi:hypothetical protein
MGCRSDRHGLGIDGGCIRRLAPTSLPDLRACYRSRVACPYELCRNSMLGIRLGVRRLSMVTKVDDKPFLERLKAQPNRSFRRYILAFKDGEPVFERDPICKAFDEIVEELCGPPADQE